ncbi:helix-turn-helix domain-containing protein [Streptomyces sp. BBFR109]|uniref:helix-turn-helix domain-containing protein n=1 Tax=Streptomyces sp. BBFR109 TaxID=3448172 RepID=UPI003F76FF5D
MTDTSQRRSYLTGDARARAAADLKARYYDGATVRQLVTETGYSHGRVVALLRFAKTEMRPRGARRPAGGSK